MPITYDPVPVRSEKTATDIYIARGDDTLGPYNSAEAAALVVGGYLHADDFAARNGDSNWVPLARFLPPAGAASAEKVPARPANPAAGARWRSLAVGLFLLAAVPLLVAEGRHWTGQRRASTPPSASPVADREPTPAAVVAPALEPPVAAPVVEAPTPPPTPMPDGPPHGSAPAAGMKITAYPLGSLETALASTISSAQAARKRLDPQIEAAAAELATRTAEEQSALQAWQGAGATDPLRSSLRFAYNGARTATLTAADNHRFLLDERANAAGGDVYFRALPEPAIAVETDTAGNYSLDLPPDGQPYAVAASARLTGGDGSVRQRYWLVRLSAPQRAGHEALRLDDADAVSSASADSLVHTAD